MTQEKSLVRRNDRIAWGWYYLHMIPRHDMYLKDWLKALGKRQADVARDLEWNKAKVSLLAAGKQQYMRDDINQLAEYLHLHPYELLMHPDDAMAFRRLKESAIRIAADNKQDDPPPLSVGEGLKVVNG